MTALVLRWRRSDPAISTQWRGADGAMLAAVASAPETPFAAIIGPPGVAGAQGPAGPVGPQGNPGPAGPAGSGATLALVEVDLGSQGRRSGRFTVGGLSGLTVGARVHMLQAPGPYTGKGARADEAEMDVVDVAASVTAGDTISAQWRSRTRVRGTIKFSYQIGS